MNRQNLEYLVTNLSSLCGVPTRIIKNKNTVFYYSIVNLETDPVKLVIDELDKLNDRIGYYSDSDFFNYAYLNYKDLKIVVGPFRIIKPDDIILKKMALNLNISKDNIDAFIINMRSITQMPLETIIQSLCLINFVLNNEKLNLSDIIMDSDRTTNLYSEIKEENKESNKEDYYSNNSYTIEQVLSRIVEHGEIDTLRNWIKNAPATRSGVLSKDNLRQAKNTFIVTTTLISRSAIKGMLDIDEAFALSDLYIQKMEVMNNINDINSLQVNMIIDYTERVSKIKGNNNSSPLLISLNKYVLNHLSDAIKVNDLCKALYISKSALFDKVKKETNLTVSDYVLNIKINEAKSLLKYTTSSISSISLYLGFSSQSHFNKTFKKFTNSTPLAYRNIANN